MNNPNIKNKRIPDDEFNAIRADVLKQWPTGREVDLKEAIECVSQIEKSSNVFFEQLLNISSC